jgi:alpha-beta hydrolase superfamily lysophospholipase
VVAAAGGRTLAVAPLGGSEGALLARLLTEQGIDFTGLLLFSSLLGFGGAFISLLISKPIAKWSTGAQLIDGTEGTTQYWLVDTVKRLSPSAPAPEKIREYDPGPNVRSWRWSMAPLASHQPAGFPCEALPLRSSRKTLIGAPSITCTTRMNVHSTSILNGLSRIEPLATVHAPLMIIAGGKTTGRAWRSHEAVKSRPAQRAGVANFIGASALLDDFRATCVMRFVGCRPRGPLLRR